MKQSNNKDEKSIFLKFTYLVISKVQMKSIQNVHLKKILNNISWLLVDKVLRMGLGFLVGVWLARYLGPEELGQLSYAITFVGMFGAIAGLGLNSIVVRDIVRDKQVALITLSSAFVMQIVSGLIAILLANMIIALISPEDKLTRLIVAIMSPSLLFKATDTVRFWFESQVQSRYVVWVENGVFLIMSLIKVIMILNQAELLSFVYLNLAEAAAVGIALVSIYKKKEGEISLWHSTLARCKSLFIDSWPLLLSAITVTIYMRIDIIMLQNLSGNREVGIYTAGTKLSEIWYFLPMVIVSSVSPYLIKCHASNNKLYLARLRKLYFLLSWLAIGIALPISLFSEQLIASLYGKQFEGSAPVLAIHLWASIAVFLGVASSQHLLVNGWLKISFYRTLLGMICNIILNMLFIPQMGAVGASIATVISYFVATLALVLFKETRTHTLYLLRAPFGPASLFKK